jgi:hypothetical protein
MGAPVDVVCNSVLGIIFEHVGMLCSKTAACSIPAVCRRWRSVCLEMTNLPHFNLTFARKDYAQHTMHAWLKLGHFPGKRSRQFPFERFRRVRSACIEGHNITKTLLLARRALEGGNVLTTSELSRLKADKAALDVEKWITRCINRLTEPARGLTSLTLITHSQCHVRDLVGRCWQLTSLKLRCEAVMLMGR